MGFSGFEYFLIVCLVFVWVQGGRIIHAVNVVFDPEKEASGFYKFLVILLWPVLDFLALLKCKD